MEFPPRDGGAAAWIGLGGYPLPKTRSRGKGRRVLPLRPGSLPRLSIPTMPERGARWGGLAGADGNAAET